MIDLENSMILEFELNKQTLKRIDNYEPVEKSQVYLQIHFNFDKDWDNTEKHVFFQFREEKVYEEILVGDTCYVPLEVIKKYGFYVWLIGYDLETHNVKIPTNQVRVAVKEGSPTDSGEATYVTDIVSDTITFEKSGNTYRAEIPNVYVTAISFNELTGQLKFLGRTENGEEKVLGEVDLQTERLIKSIVYNQEKEALIFEFDNAPTIEVPIGDMFELDDYYTKEQIAILISQMRESIIKELTDKGIFYDDSELRNEIKKLNENKVDSVEGKGLSTNDFTNALLEKLNGIEEGANKYVLPSDVVRDSNYVHTDNNYTTEEKNKLAGLQNYDDTSIREDITNLGKNTYNKTETQELIDQAIESAISSSLRGDY